ncbi:hypothetical protein V1514DRAFT_277214 [Lipomyces japonicus]|uniref:uncharacterized protein n=1 Tax=Lipomyces japonicus TaxID=56871 RepID=UPI0034CEC63F
MKLQAAGVIYGTRTYDWDTTTSTAVSSPIFPSLPLNHNNNNYSNNGNTNTNNKLVRRANTMRRIINISKSMLRHKPLPPLPHLTNHRPHEQENINHGNDMFRVITASESDDDNSDIEVPVPDVLGIMMVNDDEPTVLLTSSSRTVDIRENRRRFSFDDFSEAGTLPGDDYYVENDYGDHDEDYLSLTMINSSLNNSQPPVIDFGPQHEILLPVNQSQKVLSADEIADLTKFEFTDESCYNTIDYTGYDDSEFDDMWIDEVNNGIMIHDHDSLCADLTGYDDQATALSSWQSVSGEPHDCNLPPQILEQRHVVAYVRASQGWLVERRLRKGRWDSQQNVSHDGGYEADEESIVGTERVGRGLI